MTAYGIHEVERWRGGSAGPHTALLVIDVQNGVVAHAHDRDGVLADITTLLGRARAQDVPVIRVQHSGDELPWGSEIWQLVPEVGDAHTTEDLTEDGAPTPAQVIAYTNLYWRWQSVPGRRGGTVTTADVSFTGPG